MVSNSKVTHPLYPPNIKSLPFRLIAEWLRLPEKFKVSQEQSGVKFGLIIVSWTCEILMAFGFSLNHSPLGRGGSMLGLCQVNVVVSK